MQEEEVLRRRELAEKILSKQREVKRNIMSSGVPMLGVASKMKQTATLSATRIITNGSMICIPGSAASMTIMGFFPTGEMDQNFDVYEKGAFEGSDQTFEFGEVQYPSVLGKTWNRGWEVRNDEMVNHPKHYNRGKIEVIDFIEDQQLNFSRGCIVKGVCRAGFKKEGLSAEIEDMQKVVFYANREIARLKALRED